MSHGPSCRNCEQGRHEICGLRGCFCHCLGAQVKGVVDTGNDDLVAAVDQRVALIALDEQVKAYREALEAERADAEWRAEQWRDEKEFVGASVEQRRADRIRAVLQRFPEGSQDA